MHPVVARPVRRRLPAVLLLTAVVLLGGTPALPAVAAAPNPTESGKSPGKQASAPLIFAHRGASGYRPEHTLASYDLAIRMGADVIEPDVVSTKDRVLVVRHENEISGTTDVAARPEFANRKTTKTIDGTAFTGWFTEDFTLAELRTLRAVERLPDVRQRNTLYNGRYQVPTLQEVLRFAAVQSRVHKRRIGVAPETKHPTYFDSIGLSLEEPLLAALRAAGVNNARADIYVQSFEEANLRDLRRLGLQTHVVQLTSASLTAKPYDHVVSGDPETYAMMTTPAGLRDIATYATWLGPDIRQLLPVDATGNQVGITTLVSDAHAAGLRVVPYTFRAENSFLPVQYRRGTDPTAFGDLITYLEVAYSAGVDGVFVDQPDIAYVAREEMFRAAASSKRQAA